MRGSRLAAAALVAATPIAPATAQAPGAALHISLSSADSSQSRELVLPTGKTAVIDLPGEARDVVLSNPSVADAVVRTARRVFLIGKSIGQTNAFFFDAAGQPLGNIDIRVEPDANALNGMIARIVPDARVKAESVNGAIVLSGMAPSPVDAERIVQLAQQIVGGASGGSGGGSGGSSSGGAGGSAGGGAAGSGGSGGSGSASNRIINAMVVEGEEQVLVKVRIVEMSRTLVKQLGININAENIINMLLDEDTFVNVATANGFSVAGTLLGGLTAGGGGVRNILQPQSTTYPAGTVGPYGPSSAGVGGYSFTPATSTAPSTEVFGPSRTTTNERLTASVEAFERAGLARTLAEPNLTAISGEPAKFLAGGEFPIPAAADNGQIVIQFRPFGIGLAVTPLVLSGGRLSLKLSTEVSELSTAGAITLQGISIPALNVRRAETTVEMPSGSAMVIAGLIQESTRQAIEGVPGAKDLPVLGAAFRSRDFLNNETEIVVIVTPYLVKPTDPKNLRTPLDGYSNAGDAAGFFRARLNAVYKTPGSDTSGQQLQGPQGHVLP